MAHILTLIHDFFTSSRLGYGKGVGVKWSGGLYWEGRLALLGSYLWGLTNTRFLISKVYTLLSCCERLGGGEQDSSKTKGGAG
jgi:hypothetical protein